MTDYDQHLLIEKGIHGDIYIVSKTYTKAKRGEGYNPQQPTNQIFNLDMIIFYGWAMIQALQTGRFQWVETWRELFEYVASHLADDPKGYILNLETWNIVQSSTVSTPPNH